MDPELFTHSLIDICNHCLVSPGRSLNCIIIFNPIAGGYTIRSRWKANLKAVTECRQKALANPVRTLYKNTEVIHTDDKGSAEKITKALIDEASRESEPFYLIVSAGGDGTHREIMYALYNAPPHVLSNIALLRLPLGTGNDGADSASMAGALELLINPVHVEFAPAVQLVTSNTGKVYKDGPFLAFNILSCGLDAYVTHMTNKLKGKMPGDSYKLWLNIATLFYDSAYKVDFMDVRALDAQNNEVLSLREKLLLVAMGASGRRTYGSQELILPDERNVCCMKQMPLRRKLAIKGQVSKGKHADSPEAVIFSAHRVEFSGSHPVLAQMDGETVRLEKEDFPAVLKLTAPVIPLLKR